eukprot:9494-Heterococcus_DN1.PRE.1
MATSCHGDGFDMFASTWKRILCKRIGFIASFGQHDFLKSLVYKIVLPLLFTAAHLLLTTTIVLKTAVSSKQATVNSSGDTENQRRKQ